MKRNHTRSRSFKMTWIFPRDPATSPGADQATSGTDPATPGTFDYLSVKNPGAIQAYNDYTAANSNLYDDANQDDNEIELSRIAANDLQLPTRVENNNGSVRRRMSSFDDDDCSCRG